MLTGNLGRPSEVATAEEELSRSPPEGIVTSRADEMIMC